MLHSMVFMICFNRVSVMFSVSSETFRTSMHRALTQRCFFLGSTRARPPKMEWMLPTILATSASVHLFLLL